MDAEDIVPCNRAGDEDVLRADQSFCEHGHVYLGVLANVEAMKFFGTGHVDLVVFGSPTHNMNLPKAIQPVFERLPKRLLPGTPVAAFDTSYKMSAILARFTAAKRLAKKLRKIGGKCIISPETFYVMEREGPLYEGEIERAQDWAGSILKRIN